MFSSFAFQARLLYLRRKRSAQSFVKHRVEDCWSWNSKRNTAENDPKTIFESSFIPRVLWRASRSRFWGHLGPKLGPCWPHVGPNSPQHLLRTTNLGPSLGHRGPTWGHLGPFWANLDLFEANQLGTLLPSLSAH